MRQAATGAKAPFVRTPKVADRTAVPAPYIVVLYALLGAILTAIAVDAVQERWLHAVFGLVNGTLLLYAVVRFIGVRESLEDLKRSFG
jgi:hypothetical protein